MRTLRPILEYTPAMVMGLLVVAWVVSVVWELGFYSTKRGPSGLATIEISYGEVFFRLDSRVFSNVQFDAAPVKGDLSVRNVLGKVRFIDISGTASRRMVANLGRHAVGVPILLLITAMLPSPSAPSSRSASDSGTTWLTRLSSLWNSAITCGGRSRRENAGMDENPYKAPELPPSVREGSFRQPWMSWALFAMITAALVWPNMEGCTLLP